jgi:hypothetical protein
MLIYAPNTFYWIFTDTVSDCYNLGTIENIRVNHIMKLLSKHLVFPIFLQYLQFLLLLFFI